MAEAPLQNLTPEEEEQVQDEHLQRQQNAQRRQLLHHKRQQAQDKARRRREIAMIRLGLGSIVTFVLGTILLIGALTIAVALLPGGGSTANANECDAPGACSVNKDIIATAKLYAWPQTGHGPNEGDARPSYVSAVKRFNPQTYDLPYSDCGVFVATVMRASGADPNYFARGVSSQWPYVKSHPKLYQIIGDESHPITNTAKLKPGDILFAGDLGHTSLYTGRMAAPFTGGDALSASLHDHVPQISGWYSRMSMVARYIGG